MRVTMAGVFHLPVPTMNSRTSPDLAHNQANDRIEILLFGLGGQELFGINVFKIREVTDAFKVTRLPGNSSAFKGIISLRGQIMPVVNLAETIGLSGEEAQDKLIISEFSSRSVAFQVKMVDKIIRMPWSEVRAPDQLDREGSAVFGVVLLEDGRLVSLLDIESLCQSVLPHQDSPAAIQPKSDLSERPPVFFVDDSAVARRKIEETLNGLGLRHCHAVNGVEAERQLLAMADRAEGSVKSQVSLVLVDEEMPVMDGCALTRSLRSKPQFKDVPFVMYSSLTSEEYARRGMEAGVNVYVKKFDAETLSKAIVQLLHENA